MGKVTLDAHGHQTSQEHEQTEPPTRDSSHSERQDPNVCWLIACKDCEQCLILAADKGQA